jgi:hypothetical protein
LKVSGTGESSHKGQGIDAAVQYRSADGAIVGTAYLFYPGLPHAGLAVLATDNALRSNSPSPVTGGTIRTVSAAGVEGLALQADYGNYQNGLASSAAFLKAGRWLVKLRVSGPEARKAEVEKAMAALLGGVRIGKGTKPYPAAPVTATPCTKGEGKKKARQLRDPEMVDMAAQSIIGSFDGAGMEATDKTDKANSRATLLPSRVPAAFCRSDALAGTVRVPVLRSAGGSAPGLDGRTRLVAILSDAGEMLEVVHAPNFGRYLLLHHKIGQTAILGGWDGVPSDAQIAALLTGMNPDAMRPRAVVQLRPGKAEITLGAPQPRPVRPTS